MKVIAINSSPAGNQGHTAMILNPFLKGMKNSGAEVVLYLRKDQRLTHAVENLPVLSRISVV
jgi:multimeric flavodoxin WrbA